MMSHPIPAVRVAAAETVVAICGSGDEEVDKSLMKVDFTRAAGEVKGLVGGVKRAVEESGFCRAG